MHTKEDPYIILDQPNIDVPVYIGKKENGQGKRKTLHRNKLLSIGIFSGEPEKITTRQKPVHRPRKKKPALPDIPTTPTDVASETDEKSEEESVVNYVVDIPHFGQPDYNIPKDVDQQLIVEVATVPGFADDDRDCTEVHEDSGREEDASSPEES